MILNLPRRLAWTALGLALAVAPALADAPKDSAIFTPGPAYEALGRLAIMHEGRVKPLDTLARTSVKQVYGRETIKFKDEAGDEVAAWGPVATYYSWMANPDYWDERPFLLCEFLALKERIYSAPIRARLKAIAEDPSTDVEAARRAAALAKLDSIPLGELKSFVAEAKLADDARTGLKTFLKALGEESKFVSPHDLEEAQITVDGKTIGFFDWSNDLRSRSQSTQGPMAGLRPDPLDETEKQAIEVADRLITYQHIRGDAQRMMAPVDQFIPRPNNETYIKHAGSIYRKLDQIVKTTTGPDREAAYQSLTLFDEDTANAVFRFLKTLQTKDRQEPGTDAEFDAEFAQWLREDADWMPVEVLLKTEPETLAAAGFPADKVAAFKSAFEELKAIEAREPGVAPIDKAEAVVASARALGSSLGDYPTEAAMAREAKFNVFAPFYRAPMLYGIGLLALIFCMTIRGEPGSAASRFSSLLYALGLVGFVGGIALEVYGFYCRILISGWAPVTNMYETVVWVGLVAAVLGLILEGVYRVRYLALGGAVIAFLTTLIAASAGSAILDANIKSIPPVLRSNYWLTIHVLTIVSSYAAFALAMGLGLVATLFYLSASYRRPVSVGENLLPLPIGLALTFAGWLGYSAAKSGQGGAILQDPTVALGCGIIALIGVAISLSFVPGLLGEWISRLVLPSATSSSDGESGANAIGLLIPSLVGVTFLAFGVAGHLLAWAEIAPEVTQGLAFSLMAKALLAMGVMIPLMCIFTTRIAPKLATSAASNAGYAVAESTPASLHNEAPGEGGVATLVRPTIAQQVRAMAAAPKPKLDVRVESMQKTALIVKPLANYVYRTMQVGVLLVAAGTILGGWWADKSWGRFWGWDAKEVWALITLLIYLVPLHGRFAGWINTWGLVASSVFCFASVMMAWYGVNFVLGVGLHSYGFSEGGGQELVGLAMAAVFSLVIAAGWRRHRGLMPPTV